MAKAEKIELLTTGKIAETLGVPAAKVKKAIQELNMQPDIKKGACAYYYPDSVMKIKKAIS